MNKNTIKIILLFFAVGCPVRGQSVGTDLSQVIDLQFDSALASAREIKKIFPGHLGGPF